MNLYLIFCILLIVILIGQNIWFVVIFHKKEQLTEHYMEQYENQITNLSELHESGWNDVIYGDTP